MSWERFSGIKNRALQLAALYSPGGDTIRPMLHRRRGVKIGRRTWVGFDALIEPSYPNRVEIGDRVAIGIRVLILAHFAHQARKVRVELFNAATSARVGEVLRDEYRERNSRRTGTTNDTNSDVYLAFAIDGTIKKGKGREVVADGQYYAVFSVEKALAEAGNPAHTEQWTSASFRIDRP